jgi:hypothetical protein
MDPRTQIATPATHRAPAVPAIGRWLNDTGSPFKSGSPIPVTAVRAVRTSRKKMPTEVDGLPPKKNMITPPGRV